MSKFEKIAEILEPKYKIIIYWSRKDSSFLAEVRELPGCIADGHSYKDALENVQLVIREWLETAQFLERQIPIPKSR